MRITERQKLILDRIIEEHVDLAQPISSQYLEGKYDFGVCPATIRSEMQRLTNAGFLYQPHTSAGRVPTDKSYRFFVDSLLEKEISAFKDIFKIEEMLREEEEDVLKFVVHLSKFLATATSNLAAIHLLEKDLFWKEGWEEILREPEFEEKDFIFDFAKLLKNFEKDIKDCKLNSEIKIYIGRENPFTRAKDFSIISAKCCFPDEEEGVISLLGPKRMAYERNIRLINSLAKILEEF
ncbi:MAG: hypothetical protein ACE5J0_01390 [Candidatus Paceibacterales bacterium]